MRILDSMRNAFRGIGLVVQHEPNFGIQISFTIACALLAFLFHVTRFEWVILIFSITLVLTFEICNTVVEKMLDVVKPRLDDRVKMIKDIMAGAVLIAAVSACIIGLFIFLPYVQSLFY
jgi:diacylglycerol kinase